MLLTENLSMDGPSRRLANTIKLKCQPATLRKASLQTPSRTQSDKSHLHLPNLPSKIHRGRPKDSGKNGQTSTLGPSTKSSRMVGS
jgi:hypothetical protein